MQVLLATPAGFAIVRAYKLVGSTITRAQRLTRREVYLALKLKHVEHFEDDDDNDNDSDDVEDISVHESWITRRSTGGEQY